MLVIDEDKSELERVTTTLEAAGYQVSARATTVGTRADIVFLRPDLVLVDPSASGLRGDDLILLLGLYPETADTAVVLYCRSLPDTARRTGALGVIQKSADMASFLRRFEELARSYMASGLPKEDRAVIAERHLSGTHRVATPAARASSAKTRSTSHR